METTKYVKILQRNEFSTTKVQACLIQVTRIIERCGMFSHTSPVHQGFYSYILPIGAEECKTTHKYHSVKLFGTIINGITPNASTTASLTLAGSINMEGKCQGNTYIENGLTWENVVVLANIKISVRDYMAIVKLDLDEVSLVGGITCSYVSGYCMDSEAGESTWERHVTGGCSGDNYSVLYEGISNFVTDEINGNQFAVVEQKDRVFALTLVEKTNMCYEDVWLTEHPRLVVMGTGRTTTRFLESPTITSTNVDLMSYVNSKFLYVEQSFKRALARHGIEAVHRRCLIRREILKNRLLMTPLATNAVAILLRKQQGLIGRVLGEVLYLMECAPKYVEIRRVETCYNELPVSLGNESLFMAPITHILQEHAEQIQCSHLTPPLYQIDGEWLGFGPHPQRGFKPEIFAVREEPTPKFQQIQKLSSGGLYTNEEIQDAQKMIKFGAEREAVTTLLTRKMVGLQTESQGFTTVNLFSGEELKDMARKTVQQLWGWFSEIGIITSGMLGVYIILRIIKYILSLILNGFSLYQSVGFSYKLLASIWGSLTLWMMHREHRRATRGPTEGENELNREENGSDCDQQTKLVGSESPYQGVVIQLTEM